jgi:histidyl-tRNA synthetase
MRPELTPSLARMIAQQQRQLPKPIRWWSFGPMWRYERPQKGRSREFFQWNIDLLGVESPQADAELIAVAAEFFRATGLSASDVTLKVNNRRLMEARVLALGVARERLRDVYRAIDRIDKLDVEKWNEYACESTGLSAEQVTQLRSVLGDRDLWKQSDELVATFDALSALGVRDYIEYDASIIRGLDYYTGTVFEAWDRSGEYRAILGGGRYDNLVADVGSNDPVSGMGFAMGDVVIGLVLQQYDKIPELRPSPTQVLVTVFDADRYAPAARVATALRSSGLSVELYPEAAKLSKQLKYADAFKIRYVVIIGPDENAAGKATLRDLVSGEQQLIAQANVAQTISNEG